MLFGFFLTLGVAVLSAGLRSFQNSYAQKAGALGILAATFLGVYFVTGSWIWGFVGAMSWLFLPWLEILTRIRALRLPKEKRLRPKSPPSSDTFPGRRSSPGRNLPERAARFLVLLPAHFIARQGRHSLDNLELSALLRVKTDSSVSH
ncbi:MAG: hypothetical protein DMF20_04500 [Verrucomicrobia bacterium]|nr:MAG: hypothetical protein DMF20_04500 [Verrucomicrobiota bacterium]